jgi:hypothetical protein
MVAWALALSDVHNRQGYSWCPIFDCVNDLDGIFLIDFSA